MNFIAARLIQILSDEEAFWLMVVIQESYLPPDYYLDGLSGAIID